MARASADKPYVNFSNGLVTEVTKLNYPENSLLDVENMDIDIDGSVRRRLGLEQEANASALYISTNLNEVTSHIWKSPGGDDTLEFAVFQVGNTLLIRNAKDASLGSTASITPFTATTALVINTQFYFPTALSGLTTVETTARVRQTRFKSATGFGCLFFFSPWTAPFYLDYNRDTKVIAQYGVGKRLTSSLAGSIRIRDFRGVNDYLRVDEKPSALTMQHLYNLMNQGFPVNWAQSYKNHGSKLWPSNAQQAVLGKDAEDNFSPAQLDKTLFGNSPAPKGSAIYNVLTGDRDNIFGARGIKPGTVIQVLKGSTGFTTSPPSPVPVGQFTAPSGSSTVGGFFGALFTALGSGSQAVMNVNLLNQEDLPPSEHMSCGAFFAGRLWMSGEQNKFSPNAVYYSKVIQRIEEAGDCFQENDPTSEVISDLLDSDGGVLYIQEADGITDIVPLADGMVVLANNGVWFIRGSDSGFRATDFGVDKISDIKCDCKYTTVQADDAVYFMTSTGVHGVGFADGGVGIKTLSDDRIFSFFQAIPRASKEQAYGVFDRISKKVFWFYRDDPDATTVQTLYNKALILDARTGAFTKYTFPIRTEAGLAYGIQAAFPRYTPVTTTFRDTVVFNGETVQVDGEDVLYGSEIELYKDEKYINNLKLLINHQEQLFGYFADFKSLQFNDFAVSFRPPEGMEFNYESFLVTQPESLGDLQRDKSATYVHSFFKRTERLHISLGFSSTYDRPSSALLQGQWDWNVTPAGNRFSSQQQAYKFKRPVIGQSTGVEFDNGEEVVYTKRKVRGNGRALSLRYEAEPGKDMHLVGVSVAFTANGV